MSTKRKERATRFRQIRSDATVQSAQNWIESELGMPAGSVRILTPTGRKARSDGSIGRLRDRWK